MARPIISKAYRVVEIFGDFSLLWGCSSQIAPVLIKLLSVLHRNQRLP